MTIQCIIKDIVTGNFGTFTKIVSCYANITAVFSYYNTSFNTLAATGISAASTLNMTLNFSGGSSNYHCTWSVLRNGIYVEGNTGGNTYSYLFRTTGTYVISCIFVDNTVGKTITLYTNPITVNS